MKIFVGKSIFGPPGPKSERYFDDLRTVLQNPYFQSKCYLL